MPAPAALDPAILEKFRGTFFPAISGSLASFGPEILVTAALLLIFLADAFLPRRLSRHMAWPALAACIAASLSVLPLWGAEPRELFLGMIAIDSFANFFKLFFLLGAVPIILLTYISKEFLDLRMGEYYGILLGAVLGGMLMASANHILMAFLSLELLSISSYVLVGYQKRDRRSSEASLKYIIYGSVAAGIMAYGLSIFYGLTGSGDFRSLGNVLASLDPAAAGAWGASFGPGRIPMAVTLALLFTLAGLAFKMAAIPMHFWCPDVYEGAPTTITAFLSVGSKAAGFALAIRFFVALRIVDPEIAASVNWPVILIVVSIITMTLGNLAALWQDNLKRLLAYSSIAHAGYMMMGLAILRGGEPRDPGIASIAYYLLAYLAMNLGAFTVVILIEDRLGSVDIRSYAGLGKRAPFFAFSLAIFLFSLIGIPPTAGFAGKLQLFLGVLEKGEALRVQSGPGWIYYYVLAVAAIANTAVSVYYYARILRNMYLLERPGEGGGPEPGPAAAAGSERLRFPALGTALVAVFLFLTFYFFLFLEEISRTTLNLRILS